MDMKAWPHTHIGIARNDYGLFIGTRFLGSGKGSLLDQLLEYCPLAESAIIFPLDTATRWELEKAKPAEWVKGDDSEE